MKPNYCHIVMLLDRSGSMEMCREVTINGFNSFLYEQKKVAGEATISLIQFDDFYEVNYSFAPLRYTSNLDNESYQPRGMTALLDAIGKAIDETGKSLAKMDEGSRPSKVVFVIQTDGFENASKNYSESEIKNRIQHQQSKYNWEFVFLGAGQDAILTARQYGIRAGSALSYSTVNTDKVFRSLSVYTSSCRNQVDDSNVSFSEEDRKAAQ